MASVAYEARRGIISGHTFGADYTLDIDLEAIARPSGDDLKNRSESLSGTVETLFFGERRIWQLTIAPFAINSAMAGQIFEFVRSTADGQQFSIDPYGTADTPVQPLNVIREDDGYTEEPFMAVDGVGDYVKVTFQVREV
jgi:hypothetical protein